MLHQLVELLRSKLNLIPATDRAMIAAARQSKKANHVGGNVTVCSEAKLQELNLTPRDRRAGTIKAARANAVALKTVAASAACGVTGCAGQAHGEVSTYDDSGSKHKRSEKEFTATMEPR